jgi:hypothetical protein
MGGHGSSLLDLEPILPISADCTRLCGESRASWERWRNPEPASDDGGQEHTPRRHGADGEAAQDEPYEGGAGPVAEPARLKPAAM